MRIPAPSPVFGSQPQAPRCRRFLSTVRALSTIVWDFRPLMSTTKPTPQASCSWEGSYRPCLGGIPGEFILFDNWYASKKNVALFERLKLLWVSRAKSNTKVSFSGQLLSVSQVAALEALANYHYYAELGARVRSFEVECNGQKLKLTVIKDDPSPESGRTKFLLTNAWWLTNQEHVKWYRKRWIIEVFFRDLKQLVGLTKYEGRTEQGVINHVILVCMAYTFLQLLKPLAKVRRPSVKASKDALAPLVVEWQLSAQVEVVRPKPQGEGQVVSIKNLWHPVRTRLPGLVIPENLDLLEFTNL